MFKKITLTTTNGNIAVIALKQEQKAPRPTFPNAYNYYFDYYSEEEDHTFRVTKDTWENICRSNDPSHRLTETELKLVSLVSTLIERSPLGFAYFSLEYLCAKLNITDRQLRTVRKNINHIFLSRWRKATRINGALKKNVYVFAYTPEGRYLLGNSTKHYKSVKLGSPLPTSIYKYEKYINNRSSKSNFYKNSDSLVLAETSKYAKPQEVRAKKECEANATQSSKIIPLKQHKRVLNKRKKPTNAEIKAKQAKFLYFKQYDKPKSLGDHYPLTTEECLELQNRSGRDFTQNAMNEILLDMSRKAKLQGHSFVSKARFMSYMATVYRYEGRDAVKTANSGFKLLARATEAEIIQHTTQAERENYLNLVEQQAITHRSDETQYRAKLVGSLKPSQAYNFLSSLGTVRRVGEILELHMSQDVLFTDYSLERILSDANAVGGYCGVEKLEIIVKNDKEPSQL